MSHKTVTVLSKKPCVQCTATYRTLDKTDIAYSVEDASTDANRELALSLGYMQAPIVLVHDVDGTLSDHWTGFRPDKIDELKADPSIERHPSQELLAA